MKSAVVALAVAGWVVGLQAQELAELPTFEVTSVRPSDGQGRLQFPRSTPDRFTANAPLLMLISVAYEVLPDRIDGADGWMTSDLFSVSAKAPEGTPPSTIPLTLRTLLADRFKLVAHWEARERDVYALVMARPDGRPGPFLTRPREDVDCESIDAERRAARESATAVARQQLIYEQYFSGGPVCEGAMGARVLPDGGRESFLTSGNSSIEDLALLLSTEHDRPVIDHTGLTGGFDYRLRYVPQPPLTTSQPGAIDLQPRAEGPSLPDALEQQLGLRLQAVKAPVDVHVIDSAEIPEPN